MCFIHFLTIRALDGPNRLIYDKRCYARFESILDAVRVRIQVIERLTLQFNVTPKKLRYNILTLKYRGKRNLCAKMGRFRVNLKLFLK
jgi:hypothetical protein